MKKKKWLIVLVVTVIILALVIGVPLAINELYKKGPGYITVWDGADMLSYYGTLLGACGAVIGVYWSIHAAQKNYREDVRTRVLPYIVVSPLERNAKISWLEPSSNTESENSITNNESFYEEYKVEKLYFIIELDGVKIKYKLNSHQQNLIKNAGREWQKITKGLSALVTTKFFSIPLEIENGGNGTAINLRMGLNNRDTDSQKFTYPLSLKQGQTFYLHIFSELTFEEIDKCYTLDFNYEDIYGNGYRQSFPVSFGKDENDREWQSIDLVGKQECLREGEKPCPPLNGSEKKK